MMPAEQMREAAAKVAENYLATHGGNIKEIRSTLDSRIAAAIRALPLPPEPPIAVMEAALRELVDACQTTDIKRGDAALVEGIAALAEYEAWRNR